MIALAGPRSFARRAIGGGLAALASWVMVSRAQATEVGMPSQLVMVHVVAGADAQPELLLAQRVIDRDWGLSDDSVYVEKEIAGWRSEGAATAMSALVPGSGQVYNQERWRALWFAVAEVSAWTARTLLHRSADDARDAAAHLAGVPSDSASAWSFSRWEHATEGSAANLQQLYAADREAFYDLIAGDPRYAAGWDATASQEHFIERREASERRLHGARFSESMLWVNHVVAAVDAFRLARIHNIPLGSSLGVRVKSGWRHGGPVLTASIEGRFW